MAEPVSDAPKGACARFTAAIGGPVNYLLISIVIAAVLWASDGSAVAQFIFSALAVMPLAALMGDATEQIAEFSGPGIGGLLNATFGNAAELILGLFSVFKNLDDLVKASISGSILGNVLLVLGMSMFAGGLKYPTQTFNKQAVGTSATLCVMTSVAITVPAITKTDSNTNSEDHLSAGTSVILIFCYCLMLIFSLVTHKHLFDGEEDGKETKQDDLQLEEKTTSSTDVELGTTSPAKSPTKSSPTSRRKTNVFSKPPRHGRENAAHGPVGHSTKRLYKAIFMLFTASCFVAWMSEILVGAVEQAGEDLGINKVFMGVIIVAVVGNAAEHSTAVLSAMRDQMDVAINIALGSALQIAMFVGPVLCLCSYIRDTPLDLVFTNLEVFAILLALIVVWMVVQDGESTWMEGVLLMMLYLILALAFLFVSEDING